MSKSSVITTLLTCLIFISYGQLALAEEIRLKNGDRITGNIINRQNEIVTLETESMGIVTIQTKYIQPPEPKLIIVKGKEYTNKWQGQINTGFNRRRGNASDTNLTGGLKISKNSGRDEWTINTDMRYEEDNRRMNAQEYIGAVRYALSFGPELKWYGFGKIQGEHDKFDDIDYRYTPSTGLGYWLKDTPEFKFLIEIGGGVTHTQYISNTDTEPTTEIIPRIFIEKKITEDLLLREDFIVYPALSDNGEYRFKSVAAADYRISKKLKARISLINEYTSNPPSPTKKNDTRIISEIVYKI